MSALAHTPGQLNACEVLLLWLLSEFDAVWIFRQSKLSINDNMAANHTKQWSDHALEVFKGFRSKMVAIGLLMTSDDLLQYRIFQIRNKQIGFQLFLTLIHGLCNLYQDFYVLRLFYYTLISNYISGLGIISPVSQSICHSWYDSNQHDIKLDLIPTNSMEKGFK